MRGDRDCLLTIGDRVPVGNFPEETGHIKVRHSKRSLQDGAELLLCYVAILVDVEELQGKWHTEVAKGSL